MITRSRALGNAMSMGDCCIVSESCFSGGGVVHNNMLAMMSEYFEIALELELETKVKTTINGLDSFFHVSSGRGRI